MVTFPLNWIKHARVQIYDECQIVPISHTLIQAHLPPHDLCGGSSGHFDSYSFPRPLPHAPGRISAGVHRGILILTLAFLSPRIKVIRIIVPVSNRLYQLREHQRQNTKKHAKPSFRCWMLPQPCATTPGYLWLFGDRPLFANGIRISVCIFSSKQKPDEWRF